MNNGRELAANCSYTLLSHEGRTMAHDMAHDLKRSPSGEICMSM